MTSAMRVFGSASIFVLVAAKAHATPTVVDMTEHVFGASNTNAVTGHGGLTAGISVDGDVTVLSWPGPSFTDQLAYISGNDLNVRDEPHLGADDGMGSYIGLYITTAQGTVLAWLRDPTAFAHSQRYTQPDGPVVETTFTSGAFGLTVVLTDIVSPDVDVLTRRVVVTRALGSPVTAASLVLYENLSPTLSRIPEIPLADWALDPRNDFVAVYDRNANAVIHAHPSDRALVQTLVDFGTLPQSIDYGPIDAIMQQSSPSDSDIDGLVASLDADFPPGVAALVTTDPPPTSYQVGGDATSLCGAIGRLADNIEALQTVFPGLTLPLDPNLANALRCTDSLATVTSARAWTWTPKDALANLADPQLAQSRIAACQTNAALVAPLTFNSNVAEGSALFAFGNTVAAARTALATATSAPAIARQAAAEAAAHAALGSAVLPDPSLGELVVAVAQRALVNIYVARDRNVGAVVASVSHQPPYYLDWPRDGSFIINAMDLSGLLPWATQRGEWYESTQRRTPANRDPLLSGDAPDDPDTGDVQYPAFAWEMNYYADGMVGGNIRWEIDNTALHLWAMVVHAASLQGADRQAFITSVYPTFKDALHLLARWRDSTTNLQYIANEDDHLALTSTLHGATAVYAALVAGSRLAHAAGDDAAALEALNRSMELQQAIFAAYYDPVTGLFLDVQASSEAGTDYIPGTTGLGDTAWLVWPGRVMDPGDPRIEMQLASDMTAIMPDILGQTEGGAYVMKNVVSAALLGKDGGSRDMARDAVTRLAAMATQDTFQFGEVFVTTHPVDPNTPVFSQRVATPHVWEGTLFYLSAMALSAPQSFDPEISALPLPPQPIAVVGGCNCQQQPGGSAAYASLALLAGIIALRVRRRIRPETQAQTRTQTQTPTRTRTRTRVDV